MKRLPATLSSPVSRIPRATLVAASFAAIAAGLTACGGVQIKPDATLPKPLVVTLPTRVGLVVPADMRNYSHEETRWGVEWKIALGDGHTHLMREVFKDEFDQVEEFKDLDEARAAPGLTAIFEPRIEQYSFVTARETGGRYYAVTIRYRIDVYTPTGEKADSLTLTGYGNALAKGISSGKPLALASLAAMRDAAAKFLVQFPDQAIGTRLAKNEAVIVEEKPATADVGGIDTVPIEEPADTTPGVATPSPSAPGGNPAPAAAPVPKAS